MLNTWSINRGRGVMLILIALMMGIALLGCRGYRSDQPAIHLNPNMDVQPKLTAQTHPISPVPGVVPWGTDIEYRSGTWVSSIPTTVNMALLVRGQDQYNVYCSACHGRSGSGNGMVVKRGFTPPPKLYEERVLAYSDGQLFDLISNGIRNMPAHDKQILAADRWAIVAYVRALQMARSDVKKEGGRP